MELKRDEIIKGLDCCIVNDWNSTKCNECPIYNGGGGCIDELKEATIALINSQEQRIKELTAKITKWEEECDLRGDMWGKLNEENKRLTEDNEYLKTQLTATEARYESRKESDLEEVLGLRLRVEELTEENERLRTAPRTDISIVRLSRGNGKTSHIREVARIKMDAVRAEAVRQMKDKLRMEIERFGKPNGFITKETVFWFIDQIAKEMLEGANGI